MNIFAKLKAYWINSSKEVKTIIIVLIPIAFLFLIWPVYFLVSSTYDEILNGPKAAKIQQQLEKEFGEIQPLPGAVIIRHNASHKTSTAVVSSYYKTDMNYKQIRAYYDVELEKHGWKLRSETGDPNDEQAPDDKHAYYCKDKYVADLQYLGRDKAEYGVTYTFVLGWGVLSNECR